ncbi:hypothetical protein C8J56DRAFT_780928 [Mycena floridula]|nr:hypothetical protein C8J56DRAFT_780928 [Mycena floridula]
MSIIRNLPSLSFPAKPVRRHRNLSSPKPFFHFSSSKYSHILTFHLWNLAYHGYIPSIWESRDLWHSRMVFAAVRESRAVEGVMRVCKGWWAAIEHHPFWQQASALLDPLDLMAAQAYLHHGSHSSANSHSNSNSSSQNASHGGIHSQSRVSPYHHFRSLFSISCLVCRINYPSTNHGLAAAKRDVAIDIKDQKPGKVKPGTMFTTLLGLAPLCKEHDKKRMRFCGLCLRDSAAGAYDNRINAAYDGYDTDDALCCSENDDDETFPGVDVTCRSCRAEWLYVKAREHKADAEALGLRTRNPVFGATDYETRSVVESFIELGEGTIRDVITIARDRQWLNKHTKLRDMLNQAVLASRFDSVDQLDNRIPSSNQLSSSIPSNRPLEEEEESEEEEDADFLHMTENDGVRDLALMDWARLRILDGFWMSPADQWYGYTAPGFTRDQIGLVRTVHPVAWSIEEEAGERGQRDSQHPGQEDIHPRFSIVTGSVPPSHALCEQAFMAHRRAMTTILLPAMKNVVRKIVLEANDGYRDDGEESEIQAARMSPEDVVIALRDEGVWFEGVDWVERRRNETRTREANDSRTREANETVKGQGSDSSTNSSTSTSPVLSTTTLQTTPSPPPVDSSKQSPSSSPTSASKPVAPRPITIAVAPVLDPPRLLPSIPHVPVTVKHLPQFSLEAFKSVSDAFVLHFEHYLLCFMISFVFSWFGFGLCGFSFTSLCDVLPCPFPFRALFFGISLTFCFRGFTFALVSCHATVMVCLFPFCHIVSFRVLFFRSAFRFLVPFPMLFALNPLFSFRLSSLFQSI